jgi:cellulose synthase/poly-beta-1,6-N-acetylglucosamine synthase-like glycosyltransferase
LHPNLVLEAANRGFTIGNHSFSHRNEADSSQWRLSLELHSAEYLISRITGRATFYYRPPFLNGIGVDPTMNPYLPVPKQVEWIMENGYSPVGSDIDPTDWLASSKEDVVDRLKKALINSPKGHIVLLHEEKHTVEAVDGIVQTLKDAGYTIVPLDELLQPPQEILLTRTFGIGATDSTTDREVSLLQWFLYKNGDLDPYLINGKFDAATREALVRFQIASKIVTGESSSEGVGRTDERTRNAIAARADRVLLPPPQGRGLPGSLYASSFGEMYRYLYVNFFPSLHGSLKGMIRIALFLVVMRCIVVVIFLCYGWFRRKKPLAQETIAEMTRKQGVSILIPAYNEQENIRATVESILRSKHTRREVIVIDDGSTDRTAEIVRRVISERKGEPIHLVQVSNGGKARALNKGLEVAKYEVCAVLDADAVLHPDTLSNFLIHFSDPQIGAVAGKVGTTHSANTLDLFQSLEYAIGQNIDKRAVSILGAVGVVPGPAGMWRKSFVLELGGFSTDTLVEDQDMTLTLLRHGKKVAYEERAVAYTETPHSIRNFLKQRFRWVYGTMQCFWKHKRVMIERPLSSMTWVVLPNIFFFNIVLPLTYPFADLSLVFGLILSDWNGLLGPFAFFTAFDFLYASLGVWPEDNRFKLLCMVPLQRITYRQLLYFSVMRGVVRAIEGTGSSWNKFAKVGETQRFYFSDISANAPITHSETPLKVTSLQ